MSCRFGRKVDLAKEGLETRQADRDRHSDAVAVMRRDGDFHAEIYGEFLKDRSEFNVSVNRTKRTCLSLRRRAIRLGKPAGELEFRSKNPRHWAAASDGFIFQRCCEGAATRRLARNPISLHQVSPLAVFAAILHPGQSVLRYTELSLVETISLWPIR